MVLVKVLGEGLHWVEVHWSHLKDGQISPTWRLIGSPGGYPTLFPLMQGLISMVS